MLFIAIKEGLTLVNHDARSLKVVAQTSKVNVQINLTEKKSELENRGSYPSYLIFLLDQSGSMSEYFSPGRAGHGRRKADIVALILNNFLHELITSNMTLQSDGTIDIKLLSEVTVLGYEGSNVRSALFGTLANKLLTSLADLHMNPADIEVRSKKEIDVNRDFSWRFSGLEIQDGDFDGLFDQNL